MALSLALLFSPLAAAAAAASATEPWALPRSEVTTLAAEDGHAYRILVAWPDTPPPPEGWPVLTVLDGEDNFAIAAMTARRLARAGPRSGVAPGLVVGVDSGQLPRRVLDYSPPVPGYAIPEGAPAHGLAVGGGDRFLDFVERRLQPWLAARWRIDPTRQTLAGHSFGGLLALHAMLTGKGGFTRFAAISPSLWYGDGLVGREERGSTAAANKVAFIAVGSDERGPDGRSGSAAEALAARLKVRGARARFLSLSGHAHGTAMLGATGEVVALAFGEVDR